MSQHAVSRSLVVLALTLPVALTGPGAVGVAASPAPRADSDRTRSATPFAFATAGFGTRVTGGEAPAGSGPTAYQRIGCTNKAGTTKRISEADVDLPGLGTVSGLTTTLRTSQRRGVVAASTTQRVASVVLSDSPLGSLSIEGIRAKARALHDGRGFRAVSTTSVGRLVFAPAVGDPQEQELPSPGETLRIPGVARISLGATERTERRGRARASATSLVVELIPTDTRVVIGYARARMDTGVRDALFHGSSSGVRAVALDGLVTKGRTPLSIMPCQGTGGERQGKSLATVDLAPGVEVGAVSSRQRTTQTRRAIRGWERGSVASLDLGDGALVVDGVVGKANLVKRQGKRLRFNARGTTVGSITVDGTPRSIPDTGVLEIEGLARLEAKVTTRSKRSYTVVGLRITLLDGTGGVIDLGTARIGSKGSGLSGRA